MEEIFAIGDRVTVIREGETVGTSRIADTDQSAVIRLMVGGQADLAPPATAPAPAAAGGGAVMSVRDLSGSGFAGVDFDLARGEILGLGGLHGQGQSALLRAIFGARPITAGEITLNGQRLAATTPREAIRRGIAYVSGDRGRDGVIHGRPILENVTPIHNLRNRLLLAHPAAQAAKARPALEALHTKFGGLSHPS
ncbi:ATP-binding cassette domain-containing protein, partial [Rhizobiaceae sp. 2RAB30]